MTLVVRLRRLLLLGVLASVGVRDARAQADRRDSLPSLHHVGLNSVDPERAITWYLTLWPSARRTTVAGQPGVQAEMLLLFHKVDAPPRGAWRPDLHRSEPQSAFWHIGAFTNTTHVAERLAKIGVTPVPLFVSPEDTVGVSRSGLTPYAGTRTREQLAAALAVPSPPRDGGFSYVLAPDGVLFELTGGPDTHDALAHVHFFRERPLCSANWYAEHLGMVLPPTRDSSGRESAGVPREPCDVPYGEASWPSLEPAGTIRQPSAGVRFADGAMSWYPRQCVLSRCGAPQPLAASRGQVLDHVAFAVDDVDRAFAHLTRAGVKILEAPHTFGETRAFMFEDPDGLAVELVARVGR